MSAQTPDHDSGQPHSSAAVSTRNQIKLEAKPWGRPFAVVDKAWNKFEIALCTFTLLLEVFAMALWVSLKGMSTGPGSAASGIVFRAILGATVLGTVAYWATFKASPKVRRVASVSGVFIGMFAAKAWANAGVDYTSNLLNWFQQASTLTLVGGLRGVGTRLTILLAVLGGSLATAAGRHVTLDVLTRFLNPKTRLPMVVTGWVLTSVICAGASWGFFDHIAIENFGANAEASPAAKFSKVGHEISEYTFVARKQITLDLMTIPHVLKGEVYSHWLDGPEWDRFLDNEGFVERYGTDEIAALRIPADSARSPIVAVPGKGEPRGALIEVANLAFPIGFMVMAIRFLLLSILVLSGHMVVDSEAHMDMGTKRESATVDG
jgi:TRAP-type C4-dicarboxylate transport system permease small subunit